MKLRFRENSLRLRVNQREVDGLTTGLALRERVHFPGNAEFGYTLETFAASDPQVEFKSGTVRVTVPAHTLREWATTDAIGMYFDLPANGATLKVAIEKDLECVDGPPAEQDPDAFPRSGKNC